MNKVKQVKSPWLHRFARLVVGATFILIFVGGLVTSTDSGLAVPDWPTTYGHFMFSFPFSQMVGGILYEHGHRMAATVVGFLMTILAIWLWLKEPRKWVRWFGLAALLAVIAQGILGGITVLFLLPTAVSVSHAALAQTFFCLTICLALFTSPEWQRQQVPIEDKRRPSLQSLTIATTAAIYLQLLLGALMRHTKSGLAIPDFPLAFGKLIPPFNSNGIIIHFTHRAGALVVTIFVIWTLTGIIRQYRHEPMLLRPALLMAGALFIQLALGALTIWTQKAVIPTTAHVATGALILGTSLVLALRAHRLLTMPVSALAEGRIGEAIQQAQ
jgi:cytochrome c oxidase assembly protein subunit 15